MRIASDVALQNLATRGKDAFYPKRDDPRCREYGLFPDLEPSFALTRGATVFTIGSCFARNIEEHLTGFKLPTLRFVPPRDEWPGRSNGLLNEYNAGTIAQRIERAFAGVSAPPETVVEVEGGYADLLLARVAVVSTAERTWERRREIDGIYKQLPRADFVFITLGLVEAWVDTELDCYLNRMPPRKLMQEQPGRYVLEVMDVDAALSRLLPAFELLAGKRVIVTVSPVPLTATFTDQDVVVANAYSKSVLRVCAQRLAELPGVDYFPSYEIVMSSNLNVYRDDNVHVLDEVVGDIVQHMLSRYVQPATTKPRRWWPLRRAAE